VTARGNDRPRRLSIEKIDSGQRKNPFVSDHDCDHIDSARRESGVKSPFERAAIEGRKTMKAPAKKTAAKKAAPAKKAAAKKK
jgi:hypothetical protein